MDIVLINIVYTIVGITILALIAWAIKETIKQHGGTIFNLIVWAIILFCLYWIGRAIIGFIKYYSQFA